MISKPSPLVNMSKMSVDKDGKKKEKERYVIIITETVCSKIGSRYPSDTVK